MKNQELIQQAISLLADNQQAADLLRRFLMSNAKTNVKFDFYNYVARNSLRPAMTGVFYENGFKIATDGHILIALSNQEYPPEIEGCVIDKKANKINERFVNWRRVVPAEHTMNVMSVLDIDKIKEAVKIDKQIMKERNEKRVAVKLGESYFLPEMLLKIAIFASEIGVNELKMNDAKPNSAACVYGDGGSVGLIMPLSINEWDKFQIIQL